jgi:hypothetical protein
VATRLNESRVAARVSTRVGGPGGLKMTVTGLKTVARGRASRRDGGSRLDAWWRWPRRIEEDDDWIEESCPRKKNDELRPVRCGVLRSKTGTTDGGEDKLQDEEADGCNRWIRKRDEL